MPVELKIFGVPILQYKRSYETDGVNLTDPETFLRLFGNERQTKSGQNVTEESALTFSAVYACVKILSETIASLPLGVYRRTNNGKEKTVSANGQPEFTSEGGNNWLEYWSNDILDNEEKHNILKNVKLDKTLPTGSIQINDGASSTDSTSVTLTLTAEDSISGVSQIRFSNDGLWDDETWEDWDLSGSVPEGTLYVEVLVEVAGAADYPIGIRKNGDSTARLIPAPNYIFGHTITTEVDASRVVERYGTDASDTHWTVVGYWS